MSIIDCSGPWLPTSDGDPRVVSMYRRHYSARKNTHPKQRQCVGPGESIVLLTPGCEALFIWRRFIDDAGQRGVNCAVFRNEGASLSSALIQSAEVWAWNRWPRERLYTYVDPEKVATCYPWRPRLPGACFLFAGWRYQRRHGHRVRTQRGLYILERLP